MFNLFLNKCITIQKTAAKNICVSQVTSNSGRIRFKIFLTYEDLIEVKRGQYAVEHGGNP